MKIIYIFYDLQFYDFSGKNQIIGFFKTYSTWTLGLDPK